MKYELGVREQLIGIAYIAIVIVGLVLVWIGYVLASDQNISDVIIMGETVDVQALAIVGATILLGLGARLLKRARI